MILREMVLTLEVDVETRSRIMCGGSHATKLSLPHANHKARTTLRSEQPRSFRSMQPSHTPGFTGRWNIPPTSRLLGEP